MGKKAPETLSRVISFRLLPDSIAGQVFAKWEAEGHDPREICTRALLALGDHPIAHKQHMDEVAINALNAAITRLETLAETLSEGGPLTRAEVEEASEALKPEFLQSLRRMAQSGGFRPENK